MLAIGRADLATDNRLADGEGRAAHEQEVEDAIIAWTSTQTLSSALKVLADARVSSAPVYDAAQIAGDEHYLARGVLQTATVTIDGEPEDIRFTGVVPVLPGQEGQVRWVVPELGAHTDEVLREVLGADQSAINSLRTEGVIRTIRIELTEASLRDGLQDQPVIVDTHTHVRRAPFPRASAG